MLVEPVDFLLAVPIYGRSFDGLRPDQERACDVTGSHEPFVVSRSISYDQEITKG